MFSLKRVLPVTAIAAVAAIALSACGASTPAEQSSNGTATSAAADQFPVTIKNIYGNTTIDEKPERVTAIGWVNGDTALALNVVPVGMPTVTWGNNANASTDWADAKLDELGAGKGSDTAPARFDETDGINYDAIAATEPDVILAAYSGLTKDEYDKLSKIADVVGPAVANYQTPWEQSTELIGTALGKSAEAKTLVADTEAKIKAAADKHPNLAGTTFIAGNLEPATGGINIYTGGDNRPRLLKALGMVEAPIVGETAKEGEFYVNFSAEKADELESKIFFTWFPEGTTKESIESDKLLGRIPAVKNGGLVGTSDNQLLFSVSAANPLSLAWGVDQLADLLAAGVDASTAK